MNSFEPQISQIAQIFSREKNFKQIIAAQARQIKAPSSAAKLLNLW